MIKELHIIGLFEERNIYLNLEKDINIIVGENGTGKSHILNVVYYLMSNKIFELLKIDFKIIKIICSDHIEFKLCRDELFQLYNDKDLDRGPLGYIKRYITKSEFEELLVSIQLKKDVRDLDFISNYKNSRIKMAIRDLYDYLNRNELGFFDFIASDNINNIKKYLLKYYGNYEKDSLLYLPTYRRIEKGLQHLVHNTDLIEEFKVEDTNSLINFGMKDTQELIDGLIEEISTSFLIAYADLSENMLNELLVAIDDDFEPKQIENLNLELVELVLERVSDRISESDKKRVLSIVKQNKTTKQNYPILSMISNLIDLYEGSIKKLELRIEKFVIVCNKYLVNKKFFYDKKNVKLEIINEFNGKKELVIEQLSSGEKQIVSLFGKIYLKEINDFLIFFDEPELSLSIEWQRMLLNDIVRNSNCKFLFVTTHSPFIFEPINLLNSTVDIDDCTRPYNSSEEI